MKQKYILYDDDLDCLLITEVYDSYCEAAEVGQQFNNVRVIPIEVRKLNTEEIIEEMRKRGYYLELFSTVLETKFKYSARFVKTEEFDPPNYWEAYCHANTFKEVVRLAAKSL